MRLLEAMTLYASDDAWAGNPNIIRHSSGRFLLGFRWKQGAQSLDRDWDSAQRPVLMTGGTLGELRRTQPRLLSDCPGGLTPAFFELPGGGILAWYNSWEEHKLHTPEADRVLADPDLRPYIRFRGPDPRALGLDNENGPSLDMFGVLQPIRVMRSDDAGDTWREWGAIYHDNRARTGGTGFRGNMLRLADGAIALMLNSGAFVVSHDEGRNWEERGRIEGPIHGETFLHCEPSGRIAAVIRDQPSECLHLARSTDEGQSWSTPVNTEMRGPNPCHILPHSSGKLLLTWGRRRAPKGIRARVLRPDLADITTAPEMWVQEYPEPTSGGGYPASIELDDGTVLVVFYARSRPYGPSEIHGCIVDIHE